MGADFCHPMLEIARGKAGRASPASPLPGSGRAAPAFWRCFAGRGHVSFWISQFGQLRAGNRRNAAGIEERGRLAILEFSRVRWPVFGPLFRFYFHYVLPRVGAWISGVEGPYRYLPDSVAQFPDQDALAQMLRAAGFHEVSYVNFTGGVAALHCGGEVSNSIRT